MNGKLHTYATRFTFTALLLLSITLLYIPAYAAVPAVTTGITSGVGKDWAILNGTVTTIGDADNVTKRGFDYGLTISYGSSENTTSLTTYQTGAYSATITGLTASTVYHYRAKVYNGTWYYGADALFSTTGSPAIEWYFQTAADNATSIYGVNWASQTFTTDNTSSKTITSIRLLLDRVGYPGTVVVSLRDTSAGAAVGVDLASGTINGSLLDTSPTWYIVTMTSEKALPLSTQYAICVSASSGDVANYLQWRFVNAGGYAGGSGLTSANSGANWTAKTWDYNFEAWGNSSMSIQDVKVFQAYDKAADWLIVCRYINVFEPYYPNQDIKKYFNIQLVDAAGTVLATNPLSEWGNRVASIYLSAAQVTSLQWNGVYRIRIQGLFTGSPYVEYSLVSSDWLGTDLAQLDSWAITSAKVMQTYDNTGASVLVGYTTNVATKGEVLTVQGGDLISAGIPLMSVKRPNIFAVSYSTIPAPAAAPNTQALQSHYVWQNAVGPDAVALLTSVGKVLGGVSGDQAGSYIFFLLWALIAGFVYPPGHTMAAVILDSPLLIWAVWIGFTSLTTMGILLFIMIIVLLWQFILKQAG